MKHVEEIINQRDKYKEMMEKTNEALQIYSQELKNLRGLIMDKASQLEGEGDMSKEIIFKKAQKYKDLEEDNKKLRKLLKAQLQNSESLRVETQNTVETLRQEFEQLVKELMKYQMNDPNASL